MDCAPAYSLCLPVAMLSSVVSSNDGNRFRETKLQVNDFLLGSAVFVSLPTDLLDGPKSFTGVFCSKHQCISYYTQYLKPTHQLRIATLRHAKEESQKNWNYDQVVTYTIEPPIGISVRRIFSLVKLHIAGVTYRLPKFKLEIIGR